MGRVTNKDLFKKKKKKGNIKEYANKRFFCVHILSMCLKKKKKKKKKKETSKKNNNNIVATLITIFVCRSEQATLQPVVG